MKILFFIALLCQGATKVSPAQLRSKSTSGTTIIFEIGFKLCKSNQINFLNFQKESNIYNAAYIRNYSPRVCFAKEIK